MFHKRDYSPANVGGEFLYGWQILKWTQLSAKYGFIKIDRDKTKMRCNLLQLQTSLKSA